MSSRKSSSETADPAPPDGMVELTDPRAIRALAHPVRMSLLELLAHAGTVTATQASDALGESPANCAFHLRTLAKYGFVAEAGGGRGRERPWRRTHLGLSIRPGDGSPEYVTAAHELQDLYASWLIRRAMASLAERESWPEEWRSELGPSEFLCYLTVDEAHQLEHDLLDLLGRYADRLDHPERRPSGALPVEVLAIAYPLLHLPDIPGPALTIPDHESAPKEA